MNPRVKMALIKRGREYPKPRYPDMEYTAGPGGYVEPIYGDRRGSDGRYTSGRRGTRGAMEYPRPMNKIGFETPDEFEGNHHRDEMAYAKGSKQPGYAEGATDLSEDEAMQWVKGMKNADGTTGAHWSMDQVKQLMEQQKINLDEIDFYVTINMMYSDYCKAAKKMGVSTPEFYACMAKAFLEDKDAQPGKLANYYIYIAKH